VDPLARRRRRIHTRGYRRRGRLLDELIGNRTVASLTENDGRELVAALSAHETRGGTMTAGSVKAYFGQARQVLDHARRQPNPFRDELLRSRAKSTTSRRRRPRARCSTILDRIPPRHVLPLALLEQTGMRVGELALAWGDVDTVEARLRLKRSATKTNRPRWVQVPRWLMDALEQTCPTEDRAAGRRVFPAATDAALRQAMARACRAAGIPLYSPARSPSPADLALARPGIPQKELSERVGHIKASETLDRYAHVMPLDELTDEQWTGAFVVPAAAVRRIASACGPGADGRGRRPCPLAGGKTA
jgi:integrase